MSKSVKLISLKSAKPGGPETTDGEAGQSDNPTRKPDGAGGQTIDPAAIAGSGPASAAGTETGGERKPRSDRGRERGPHKQKRTFDDNLGDLTSIAEWISEIHAFAAFVTGMTELNLDESKGEHVKIATGLQRVARHYDLPGVDPKTADWMNLCKVLAAIYGRRLYTFTMRTRSEAAKDVTPAAPPSAQAPPQAPPQNAAPAPMTMAPQAPSPTAPPTQETRPPAYQPGKVVIPGVGEFWIH